MIDPKDLTGKRWPMVLDAVLGEELAADVRAAAIEEDVDYREWIRRRIAKYLSEGDPRS